jgi:serine/threonine-protein kinase
VLEFQRQFETDVCAALAARAPALQDDLRRLERCWTLGLSLIDQALEQRLVERRLYEAALPMCPARAFSWEGYTIEREAGRGAAGVVYRAHRGSDWVAVKLLRRREGSAQLPGPSPDRARAVAQAGRRRRRFEREAELLKQLEHPAIVRLRRAGVVDGQPFQVTEWLPGGSLASCEGDPRRALRWTQTLAEALSYAHQQGVVHRDIKPANVLLDAEGRPKLVDFGLAKLLESDEDLTASGTILGTPDYAAPELLGTASEAGPISDVYGLTALLHFLLVGRSPFVSRTLVALRRAIEAGPRPLAAELGLPTALDALIRRGLDPDVRIRLSLDELRQGLEAIERQVG